MRITKGGAPKAPPPYPLPPSNAPFNMNSCNKIVKIKFSAIISQKGAEKLMTILFAFIGVSIFLLGLYQWAQSGAGLWRIFSLKRREKEIDDEVKKLEEATDRRLSTSFRILAWLGVFVWLILGVTMILDMFGIDWINTIGTHAKTYWARPGAVSDTNTMGRNDVLRNMGNSLRR